MHALTNQIESGHSELKTWRAYLREKREALQASYEKNGSPSRLLGRHAKLIDHILQSIWEGMEFPPSVALLAVGGYGRGELYPHSDVDVLILLEDEPNESVNTQLEKLVGMFWDMGLEIGHSVRTLEECIQEAKKDITVQTNMLETRLLSGDKNLFKLFCSAVTSTLDQRVFYEAKYLEQQQRYNRFHDTSYNLEPNIKESPGGLRDLQNILWISKASGLGHTWRELADQGLITADEAKFIEHSERQLQTFRIQLHYLAKRREDRLLFDYQAVLAEKLGIHGIRHHQPSELLMRRYYRTAKRVRLMNEILLLNLRARIMPKASQETRILNDDFQITGGLLEIRHDAVFQNNQHAILESFLLAQQQTDVNGMGPQLLRALWRSQDLVDAEFRRDPANRRLFMEILRQPLDVTNALRHMNQYGILGRYLPAFGKIIGQMQHDLFHVYTVDEHILFVVRNLRRFTVPDLAYEYPLCSRLINNFARPEVLYIAGLFHDIAKGRGGDHSRLGSADARRFCRAHDLSEEDTDLVAWLVENHLVMSSTAQKQDLGDPEVIASFASRVKDERHLNALYLLTVADIRGTSPIVWNAWKGKLLEDLFRATRRYLGGELASSDKQLEARQLAALLLCRQQMLPEGAHQALWSQLDESYFMRHEANEIAWHTRLLYDKVNTAAPIVRARVSNRAEGIQVMIYTHSKPGLFALICGFFERVNYNIVEAKIFTTAHGYSLNSFLVLDEGNTASHYRDLLNFIEYELTSLLKAESPREAPVKGRLSRHLKHFPIEPMVSIRPDEKGIYHIISVTAGDRPGLLSSIAQVFLHHQIQIHTAKITTLGERAEDTFLITAKDDILNNSKAVVKLETDLLEVLRT